MKNMLNFKNFSAEELQKILDLALDMKKNPEKYSHALEGKKLYTLFEKTSTRTFLSFTTGMTELGGTYYNQLWKDSNFVLGEPVSEIKYVCRNVDIIMARLVKNETVELFGDNVTVPFINGCDNSYHPCQILADALTIIEKFGSLNVKFLYIGAKNNVFNSLVEFQDCRPSRLQNRDCFLPRCRICLARQRFPLPGRHPDARQVQPSHPEAVQVSRCSRLQAQA